jgi:hypothetical protein
MRAVLAVQRRPTGRALLWAALAVAVLFILPPASASGSTPAAPAHSDILERSMAPGQFAPAASAAHATGVGLRILSFTASPNPIGKGISTTFRTTSTGATGWLNYSYPRLPPGCLSANTSLLSCTPSKSGSFVSEVQLTDSAGSSAFANFTLNVLLPDLLHLYVGNSSLGNDPVGQQFCSFQNSPPFYSSTCYPQAQQPTALSLANGEVALAYSSLTNATANSCPGAAANTSSRVEFAISGDGGVHFGAPQDLGNDTCAFLDALEPAFAVDGSTVYGVFIEANIPSSVLPSGYDPRPNDGLALVIGAQNGTHWSAPTTILAGSNLARPSLAVHGSTLYVGFEQIANSSVPLPGGVLPIAVQFLASTDAGARWGAPVTLPGLNVSQQYDALSPSVAVGPTGIVSVAYATNRSCSNATGLSGGCAGYWDDVVAVSSSTNGSSWSTPLTAAPHVGENECASSGCWSGYYQSTPQVAAAYDPAGDLLVAVAGGEFSFSFQTQNWYRWTGVELALLASGAKTFSLSSVASPYLGGSTNFFDPGLGVKGHEEFLSYSEDNESLGGGDLAGSLSTWLTNATIASTPHWATPTLLRLVKLPPGRDTNSTAQSFVGYSSSVAFNRTGFPLVAFSQASAPVTLVQHGPGYYYTNVTYATNLTLALIASAADTSLWTTLTVNSSGLPANTSWSLSINGATTTANGSGLYLEHVPRGSALLILPGGVGLGAWTNVTQSTSLSTLATLNGPSFDAIQYALQYGFAAYSASLPKVRTGQYAYTQIDASASGTFPGLGQFSMYFDWYYNCDPPYYCGTSLFGDATIYNGSSYQYYYYNSYPIYVPKGLAFSLFVFDEGAPDPSYANGTGLGAYNGRLVCNGYCTVNYGSYRTTGKVDIESPGNESIWFGGAVLNSTYNLTVAPEGLPAGTPYSFTWSGTPYGATAPRGVSLRNIAVGGYSITDIAAPGPLAGWEYFGYVLGGEPVVVPFAVNVTLRFGALVNLSAPPGTVSFHAANLTAGTSWQLDLNGTTYAASTPWINTTIRPGTYSLSASPATGASGDSGFVPVGVGPNVTLPPGTQVVNLSFVPSFRFDASSSLGGDLSVNGGSPTTSASLWGVPGTHVDLLATAYPGYLFLGWNGTGSGSYSGSSPTPTVSLAGPVREVANFLPLPGARFNLTFEEYGLAPGTGWGVSLNGFTYAGSGTSITVDGLYGYASGPQGSYALAVAPAYANGTQLLRYLPGGVPPVVGTNGSGTPPILVQFAGEGAVSVAATVGGFATVASGGVQGSLVWVPNATPALLSEAPVLGYSFAGWNGSGVGSYTGLLADPTLTPTGSPIVELATFTPNPHLPSPTYAITFFPPAAAPTGVSWAFLLGGAPELITGSSLTVAGLAPNTYSLRVEPAMTVDGETRFLPAAGNPLQITISDADLNLSLEYTVQYLVTILAGIGGTPGANSGWYTAGITVSLAATPDGTHLFSRWSGTGNGSYTGTMSAATFTVAAPISELAEFLPAPVSGTTVVSLWENPGLLGGLLVLELAAGAVAALLLWRRRRGPSDPAEAAPEETNEPLGEPAPEDGVSTTSEPTVEETEGAEP